MQAIPIQANAIHCAPRGGGQTVNCAKNSRINKSRINKSHEYVLVILHNSVKWVSCQSYIVNSEIIVCICYCDSLKTIQNVSLIISLLRRSGGYTVLPLSVRHSVRHTFFSAITYRSLLIFCIKLHIGMLYCGMPFEIHPTSTSCLPRKKDWVKIPKNGTFTIFYVEHLLFIRF